jgi:hypothetical protein
MPLGYVFWVEGAVSCVLGKRLARIYNLATTSVAKTNVHCKTILTMLGFVHHSMQSSLDVPRNLSKYEMDQS